jgi:hypothetical protein
MLFIILVSSISSFNENRFNEGESKSKTPTVVFNFMSGMTSSDLLALSQAICSGILLTSPTRIV